MKLLSTISVFTFFFNNTNSSPWANVCSAQRVNRNQVGALAHRPAAQSTSYLYRMQILAAHGTLEKYIGLENHCVFRTHTLSRQLEGKPVMKKVCASALRECLHMWGKRWCISTQTAEPDTRRTWGVIMCARAGARQGLILTIVQNVSATTEPATIWETNREGYRGMCTRAKDSDPLQGCRFPSSKCILSTRCTLWANTATLFTAAEWRHLESDNQLRVSSQASISLCYWKTKQLDPSRRTTDRLSHTEKLCQQHSRKRRWFKAQSHDAAWDNMAAISFFFTFISHKGLFFSLCAFFLNNMSDKRRHVEDHVPGRGWVDCRHVCGIYWGSQTEGPPTEFSKAFQPAPSPASVSCRKRENTRWRSQQEPRISGKVGLDCCWSETVPLSLLRMQTFELLFYSRIGVNPLAAAGLMCRGISVWYLIALIIQTGWLLCQYGSSSVRNFQVLPRIHHLYAATYVF